MAKKSKYGNGKRKQQVKVVNSKTGKVHYRSQTVGTEHTEEDNKHRHGVQYLQSLASITSGKQKEYFDWQLRNVKEIQISPISELPQEVQSTIASVGAELKQCYTNATKAALEIGKDCKYVEGYTFFHGIPIEHAWIKYQDKYYDTTAEIALQGRSDMGNYSSVLELDQEQIIEMMSLTQTYGTWMGKWFFEKEKFEKSLFPWAMRKIADVVDAYPTNIAKSSNDMDSFRQYADCIVVNEEGKLLLLYRNDDDFEPRKWCLPGGKVEEGESFDEGALRELWEETNIIPSAYSFLKEYRNNDGSISAYFETSATQEQLMILDANEHYNWMWADSNDLKNLDLILNLGDRLEELLKETQFGMILTNPFKTSSIIQDETINIDNSLNVKEKEDAAYYIIKTAYDQGKVSEDVFLKACSQYTEIRKGKVAQLGEIREWKGKKMQKTANGWIPVGAGKKGKAKNDIKDTNNKKQEEEQKPKYDESQLSEHAQNSSEQDLKKTISTSKDEKLRDAAKAELDRRNNKDNPDYGIHEKLKEKVGTWHKKQIEFYQSGALNPDSHERKDLANFLRKKAKGVVKSVKHEVHEFEQAGSGLKKFFSGKRSEITKHEQKAIKQIALHSAMVLGTMAMTGGTGGLLSGGIAALTKGFGLHYLEHAGLMRIGHAMLFAKADKDELNGASTEELVERLINEIINHIENGQVSEDDFMKMGDNASSDFDTLYDDEDEDNEDDQSLFEVGNESDSIDDGNSDSNNKPDSKLPENDKSNSNGEDKKVSKDQKVEKGEKLEGGLADGKTLEEVAEKHSLKKEDIQAEFDAGLIVEKEHTDDGDKAKEIVLDHLYEDAQYYTKLKKIEKADGKYQIGEISSSTGLQKFGEGDWRPVKAGKHPRSKQIKHVRSEKSENLRKYIKSGKDESLKELAKAELKKRGEDIEEKE